MFLESTLDINEPLNNDAEFVFNSESVENAIDEIVKSFDGKNVEIWTCERVIRSNEVLSDDDLFKITAPPFESKLLIVDLQPNANWCHDCEYYYINLDNGSITKQAQRILPDSVELFRIDDSGKSRAEIMDLLSTQPPIIQSHNSTDMSHCWAVIISGGQNPNSNRFRYFQDCIYIYRTLKESYGYTDDHIYTLISDGKSSGLDVLGVLSTPQDLDQDGVDDIDYSATSHNVSLVFSELATRMSYNDKLLVFVTDHGERRNNQSYICLWSNSSLSQTQLRQEVNKLPGGVDVNLVLGQCYSGGFIDAFRNRPGTTVTTACQASQLSYSNADESFNAFLYEWCSAMAGWLIDSPSSAVNADYDGDSDVSYLEAFKYAHDNDPYLGGDYLNGVYCAETPQYFSNSSLQGYRSGLSGDLFQLSGITGPNAFNYPQTGQYTLHNLHQGAYVTWNYSPAFDVISQSPTTLVVSPSSASISNPLLVRATINVPALGVTYDTNTIDSYSWGQGIFFSNDLITGNVTQEGGIVYLAQNYPGISNIEWQADGFFPTIQGYATTELVPIEPITDSSIYVTVSFLNPFGGNVTIVKEFFF